MFEDDGFGQEVVGVLAAVPEFAPRLLALVEAADGDPGAALAFGELADFAAELAAHVERAGPVLDRLLAGVEEVARHSPDAEELVGWGFLDSLSPDDLRRLGARFGPATRALLESLEIPVVGDLSPDAPKGAPEGALRSNVTGKAPIPRAAPGGTSPGWSLGG